MSSNVFFKRGLLNKLPSTYTNGTFYVTTDERALYLDISDTERIRLGDFQEYENWAAIQAITPNDLQSTALYYAKAENILAKYDATTKTWKQINPDSYVDVVTMSVVDGPVVTEGTSATIQTSVQNGGGTTTVKSDSINIVAKGAAEVSVDGNGNLVITATDTDTKVTSADNHYDPTTVATDKQVNAAGEGSGFVTGIVTDGKGHIVKLTKSEQTTNAVTEVDVAVSGTEANKAVISTSVKDGVGTHTDSFTVVGGTNVEVTHTGGTNGVVTIAAKDEKTTLEGHYTPAQDSTIEVTDKKVISKILKDAKGHITGTEERNENDVSSVTCSTTGAANEANITTTVVSTAGTSKADTVQFVGAGSTTVTASGKVVTITSVDNDEHTTEAGHYEPSVEDTSKSKTATAGKVISGIKLDSKNHVVGIVETDASDVESVELAASGSNNDITITSTVKSTSGSDSDTLKVTGSGATTVSVTTDGINIASTDQSVADAAHHYKATGVKEGTHAATGGTATDAKATTQVVSGVTTDAAGHVTGVTSVGIVDTHANIEEVIIANGETSGFAVTVKDTDGVTKTATYDPAIKLGDNDTTYKLENGVFTLPVYNKTETDKLIGDAIANTSSMVLVGEVNGTTALPSTGFNAGDTYLVTEGGTYQGQVAEAGDLFVAKYDSTSENHTGTIADWYYVPSGNDVTKLEGIVTETEKGFYLTEGDENTPTPGSKVLFTDTNIVPTVLKAADSVKVSFNMVWGEF